MRLVLSHLAKKNAINWDQPAAESRRVCGRKFIHCLEGVKVEVEYGSVMYLKIDITPVLVMMKRRTLMMIL